MKTILAIVQDDTSLNVIRTTLSARGMQVLTATATQEGFEIACRVHPAVIITDAGFTGSAGMLARLLDRDPAAQILLLTENYSSDEAMEGIRRGACGYLVRPLSEGALLECIEDLLDQARLRYDTMELDAELLQSYRFHGMVGRSPQMLETFARIRRVAPHYRVALISGATGTGKELVAQAMHSLSPVANRRFVVCNCSAIVETLFESELFGHVKGAFTGASQDRVGLFEYAQGGTVFLDEISDMPLSTQSKLLRVVQNRELQRVGSSEVRKVEVRVIAASNRDLTGLIADNLFREDLYYRLSMVELRLPRLADRKEDVPLLERHFIEKFAQAYHKRIAGISRRAQALLAAHGWPGNVREMENALGHACMMTESEFIDVRDLPEYLRNGLRPAPANEFELMSLAEVERRYAQAVLAQVGGNKLQAAQILGISRATLYRILRDAGHNSDKPLIAGNLNSIGGGVRLRLQ